jgi:ubiquinone/menaquinone biosynthesis C-methylase UbiE
MDEKQFYDRSNEFLSSLSFPTHQTPWRRFLIRNTEDRFERAAACLNGGYSFLDLGCGDGQLTALAMRNYSKVNGVDITGKRVEEARNRCISFGKPDQIGEFLVTNLNEPIPFPDSSMDAISAISVLEHVFDVYDFVRECRRVLKPQGVLVIEVPNLAYFKHRIRLVLGYLPVHHRLMAGLMDMAGMVGIFTISQKIRLQACSQTKDSKLAKLWKAGPLSPNSVAIGRLCWREIF